ncbi:MAG: class I SAM-dependent methyltransferase [Candidatus Omnitrophica bacterium]|nr:class I SAM-dependent methyltransferase [Candidatus Omnitrophota bacterium]
MIKLYLKRAKEIESYLAKNPKEWGKFQSEFNSELNGVFRNIMDFEKENLANGNEDKVYKLKQLFINKFKHLFARGVYCDWSIRKPYGYSGDFQIIDDIYQNNPATSGFDRLFDNYFQMSAISVAVRNRKEDFKRIILDFVANRKKPGIRIMDLASGPCREIKEILSQDGSLSKNLVFDCYDNDINSLEYAKKILGCCQNINFIKENAIRIALKKDIHALIDKKYDLIYSTGLFDYFNEKIAVSTISNLKKLLNPDGIMAIATVRDKYSNPSVHFMEWAGDWNLIYRNDEDFKKIFIDSGFKESEIEIQYEQQGIIQYIIAPIKK